MLSARASARSSGLLPLDAAGDRMLTQSQRAEMLCAVEPGGAFLSGREGKWCLSS